MQRPQRKEVALAARRPAPRRIRVAPPGRGGGALGADPAVLAAAPAFGARPSPAFELCGDLARHVAPPAPAKFNASSALARTLVLVVSGNELHRARLGPLRCAWARRVPRWVVVSDACAPGMPTVRARRPGDWWEATTGLDLSAMPAELRPGRGYATAQTRWAIGLQYAARVAASPNLGVDVFVFTDDDGYVSASNLEALLARSPFGVPKAFLCYRDRQFPRSPGSPDVVAVDVPCGGGGWVFPAAVAARVGPAAPACFSNLAPNGGLPSSKTQNSFVLAYCLARDHNVSLAHDGALRAGKACDVGQLQTAPLSVVSHAFWQMFGRAIISRSGFRRECLSLERACARNAHVEATVHHPFPAQARSARTGIATTARATSPSST